MLPGQIWMDWPWRPPWWPAPASEGPRTRPRTTEEVRGKWTTPSGQGGMVTYTFKGRNLKVEAPSRTYEITVTLDAASKAREDDRLQDHRGSRRRQGPDLQGHLQVRRG